MANFAQPSAACAPRGAARVQLVRRDGRDLSTLYGREGGAAPLSGAAPRAAGRRLLHRPGLLDSGAHAARARGAHLAALGYVL